MKYVFDKNGIIDSENTERLVQYSINANELQVAFTDLNIREYVPYVAFERADGKVSPLIGMAFDRLNIGEEVYDCATYKFSDSWVTAVSGVLKVAIILKKNNVNARTSTFNLNVAESVSEDKVNYIDDVAYNELVGRVYQLEQKQQDIINGDVVVKEAQHALNSDNALKSNYATKSGSADKATMDAEGNVFSEHYATNEKVDNLSGENIPINSNDSNSMSIKEYFSEFYRQLNVNIANLYAAKKDTYTKQEVLDLVNSLPKFSVLPVDLLPTENISNTTIYLLSNSNEDEDNYYEEYIYVNNKWELIGTTKIDLSQYVTNEIFNSVSQALWQKTLANETALENAKLSFVNKNYTKINYEGKTLKRNYSPTTISKGKWVFRDNNNTINYTAGSMTANFIDTFGNVFYNLEFMGSTISAYNGVIYTKILDTVNKTGLAYKDGVINEEYAIEFLDEINASEIIRLINDEVYVAYKYDYIDVYETLKNNYYDKEKVNELINDLSTLSLKVVNELPTENISTKTIYLLNNSNDDEDNYYDEYLYIEDHWELIGTTKIDLSDYALKSELFEVNEDVKQNTRDIRNLEYLVEDLQEKQVTKLSDLKNDIKLLNKDGNIVAYKPIEMGLYNFTNGYFYFIPDFKNLVTYDSVENCSFYDSLGNQYTQLQTIAGTAENSSGKVFNTAVVYGIDINGVKHLLMGANAENKQITGYATDVDYYIKFTDTSEFNINSLIRLVTLCVQYDEDVVYKEVASKEYVDSKSGGAANINVAVRPKTLIGKWNIYKNFDNVKYPEFGIKKRINFKDSDNRQFIGINITHAYYIDENHTYGYSRIYAAYDETTFESGIGILILNTENNTGMCLENGEFKKDYYLIFEIDDNEIMQKLQPVAVKIENNSNANLVSVDFIEDKLGNIESILDTLNGEVV